MDDDQAKKLAELEAAARKSTRFASVLIGLGLALFLGAIFYASSSLGKLESKLQQKRQEEGELSLRIEKLAQQEVSLKAQVAAQAALLAETSRAIEEKTKLLEEISAKTKARQPLGQPIINKIETEVTDGKIQEQTINAAVQTSKKVLLPRVYLHIANEGQRNLANQIQQYLTEHGFLAPGVQNVAGKAYIPDSIEVRYLRHPEDRDKADAVFRILKDVFHITNCRLSYTERGPRDRPGHIEVWFSRVILRDIAGDQ
jgi:hypothetical protein